MNRTRVVAKARRTTPPVYRLDHHRWRTLKRKFKQHSATRNAPCWLAQYGECLLGGDPIDYTARGVDRSYETDHYHPRKTHKHLMYEWSNLRASHQKCNRSRQAKAVDTQQVWARPKW